MWEWDIPKKKSKKGKKEKGKEKDKKQEEAAEEHSRNGGAFLEEVAEATPETRPTRNRNVLIEEVEDDDA